MNDPALRIQHEQNDDNDSSVSVKNTLSTVEAEDAIRALQAKMASYPLPTVAISNMTPPTPIYQKEPAIQASKSKTTTTSQTKAIPQQRTTAPTPKVTKSSVKVVAESPTELKFIHEEDQH